MDEEAVATGVAYHTRHGTMRVQFPRDATRSERIVSQRARSDLQQPTNRRPTINRKRQRTDVNGKLKANASHADASPGNGLGEEALDHA